MSLKNAFLIYSCPVIVLIFAVGVLFALNSYTRYVYTRVKRIAGREVSYDGLELD